jgi:hypothetical protein
MIIFKMQRGMPWVLKILKAMREGYIKTLILELLIFLAVGYGMFLLLNYLLTRGLH